MGQELHNDKLFQAAKQHLENLEVPYDESGWEKMNQALSQQPKGSGMHWKLYLNGLLVLLGAGTLTWGGWALAHRSGTAAKTSPAAHPAGMLVKNSPPQQALQPVSTAPAAATVNPPATAENTAVQTADPLQPGTVSANTLVATTSLTHTKKQKASAGNVTKSGLPTETDRYSFDQGDFSEIPANGTKTSGEKFIFPDQIDPVRGIMRRTHEDPATYDTHTPPDPYKLNYYESPGKKVNLSPDSSKNGSSKENMKKDSAGSAQPH